MSADAQSIDRLSPHENACFIIVNHSFKQSIIVAFLWNLPAKERKSRSSSLCAYHINQLKTLMAVQLSTRYFVVCLTFRHLGRLTASYVARWKSWSCRRSKMLHSQPFKRIFTLRSTGGGRSRSQPRYMIHPKADFLWAVGRA